MTSAKDVADIIQDVAAAAGIVVGGAFTYFKFIKRRVFWPRAEVMVECNVTRANSFQLRWPVLVCYATLRGLGNAEIPLERHATVIKIYRAIVGGLDQPVYAVKQPVYILNEKSIKLVAEVVVFRNHKQVESGETIHDVVQIAVDCEPGTLFRVELHVNVVRPKRWWLVSRPLIAHTASTSVLVDG